MRYITESEQLTVIQSLDEMALEHGLHPLPDEEQHTRQDNSICNWVTRSYDKGDGTSFGVCVTKEEMDSDTWSWADYAQKRIANEVFKGAYG